MQASGCAPRSISWRASSCPRRRPWSIWAAARATSRGFSWNDGRRAHFIGVDNSTEMLAKARETVAATGSIEWQQADLADWAAATAPASVDLVFSNAALHWIDDHATTFSAAHPNGCARRRARRANAVELSRAVARRPSSVTADAQRSVRPLGRSDSMRRRIPHAPRRGANCRTLLAFVAPSACIDRLHHRFVAND